MMQEASGKGGELGLSAFSLMSTADKEDIKQIQKELMEKDYDHAFHQTAGGMHEDGDMTCQKIVVESGGAWMCRGS